MELASIHTLLGQRIGLDPTSIGEETVAHAVRQRIAATGCPDLARYLTRLDAESDELQALVEEVIVSETWFFREASAFEALRCAARKAQVAPGRRPMLIASLPCATGEEPYSIAMALLDLGLAPDRFRVHAMDVSERSLLRAQEGLFGENSFRTGDNAFRARYFEPLAAGYRILPAVRGQVSFYSGSAVAPAAPFDGRQSYDVVFCRNMLIYMDGDSRVRVAAALRKMLAPAGILLAAHAEVPLLLQLGFERTSDGALRVRRSPPASAVPTATQRPARRHKAPAQPAAPAPRPLPFARPDAATHQPPLQAEATTDRTPAASLRQARTLADAGRLEEARQRCTRLIEAGVRDAELYYLMGLVLQGQGAVAESREYFRKAVYLDAGHAEAKLHLALTLRQEGEAAQPKARRPRGAHD